MSRLALGPVCLLEVRAWEKRMTEELTAKATAEVSADGCIEVVTVKLTLVQNGIFKSCGVDVERAGS